MYSKYDARHYRVSKTATSLKTTDPVLSYVFNEGERLCLENVRQFGSVPVIREGAKYDGVWLETQPMGGEMYATRNMEIALNNHLIFMKYQRRDGKMPGMITCSLPWRGIAPNHDWMQGDFFTRSAMRMYYLIGKDKEYLSLLYDALVDFEDYLWTWRDSDGNGCLESFCVWDTGDDNNTKLLCRGTHAINHGLCFTETPPTDHGVFPIESSEYMAYSYSHNVILAEISDILGKGEGEKFRQRAEEIKARAIEYLYDKERHAFFDRDKNNEVIDVLSLQNVKCMYHGLFTQQMADDFIREHLLNPEEFYTPLPLPNIAANDPIFNINDTQNNFTPEIAKIVKENSASDMADNSWSGPVQGLSHQRVIDALINYGHHAELTVIGRKWINNIAREQKFSQQYDPFTGKASPGADGYGPSILSSLEYVTHLVGIDYNSDVFTLSAGCTEGDTEYSLLLFGDTYTLKREGGVAQLYKNGSLVLSFSYGVRVMLDRELNPISIVGMEPVRTDFTLSYNGKSYHRSVCPNEFLNVTEDGLTREKQIAFDLKQ